MGGMRHGVRWSRAVLALLAALALLFVSVAVSQAVPCHDPAGHQPFTMSTGTTFEAKAGGLRRPAATGGHRP
jgi:hypothetical protein